jgi:uncharacterized protein YmfQ (DUF2313 family)
MATLPSDSFNVRAARESAELVQIVQKQQYFQGSSAQMDRLIQPHVRFYATLSSDYA